MSRLVSSAALCVLTFATLLPMQASASNNLELNLYAGYNIGGNIDYREDNNTGYKLLTDDSFATGLGLAFVTSPTFTFELYWAYRPTNINVKSRTLSETKLIGLNAHDFHGNLQFMPAYTRGAIKPYLQVGLGLTLLDPEDLSLQDGTVVSLDSETKFSWSLAGGFKAYGDGGKGRMGIRGQVRYHSTYVSDEYGGTWCDPFYGCYDTVDTNWIDEWDFQGALIIRLGQR